MSERLRFALYSRVEEEKHRIDREFTSYADALILSVDPSGITLTINVEGVDVSESQPTRRILDELCKAALVTTDIHFTHRNAQLIAHATPLGVQIAQQLKQEKQ
jgi:hypothetical protein